MTPVVGNSGPLPVFHFDFYRLTSADEIAELGFDDYFQGDGVCIAEWSERLGDSLPPDHLSISFQHLGEDSRRILINARGRGSLTVLDKVRTLLAKEEIL